MSNTEVQMWLVRDYKDNLTLHEVKPKVNKKTGDIFAYGFYTDLNPRLFKEVTMNNSPVKVTLTINN